jgi:hypothetical protein
VLASSNVTANRTQLRRILLRDLLRRDGRHATGRGAIDIRIRDIRIVVVDARRRARSGARRALERRILAVDRRELW